MSDSTSIRMIEYLPDVFLVEDVRGYLSDFLGALDETINAIRSYIVNFKDSIIDIDTVDDSYIEYISKIVGYKYKYLAPTEMSRRKKVKLLVDMYKRKTTSETLNVIFNEADVVATLNEMVDTVLVTSTQGYLSSLTGFLQDRDYHHEGSLEIETTTRIDTDLLRSLFEDFWPLGFKMWLKQNSNYYIDILDNMSVSLEVIPLLQFYGHRSFPSFTPSDYPQLGELDGGDTTSYLSTNYGYPYGYPLSQWAAQIDISWQLSHYINWIDPTYKAPFGCVAIYRFETESGNGKFTKDITGVHDLQEDEIYKATRETTQYKTGSSSLATNYNSGSPTSDGPLFLQETNMSSRFPLKSGTNNNKLSIAFWYYTIEPYPSWSHIESFLMSKASGTGNSSSSFRLYMNRPVSDCLIHLNLYCGSDNISVIASNNSSFKTGYWNHFGMSIDGETGEYILKSYSGYDGSTDIRTGTLSLPSSVNKVGDLVIGDRVRTQLSGYGEYGYYGYIDDILIFNKILTEAQIDGIRDGSLYSVTRYPSHGWILLTSLLGSRHVRQHFEADMSMSNIYLIDDSTNTISVDLSGNKSFVTSTYSPRAPATTLKNPIDKSYGYHIQLSTDITSVIDNYFWSGYSEDFESPTFLVGNNLDSTGGWTAWPSNDDDPIISNSQADSGSQSVEFTTSGPSNACQAYRSIGSAPNYITDGTVFFSVRSSNKTNHVDTNSSGLQLEDIESPYDSRICVRFGSTDIILVTGINDQVETLVSGYSNDTWYRIGLEFHAKSGSSGRFRAKVNGGSWGSWQNMNAKPVNGLGIMWLRFNSNANGGHTLYFDNITTL